ncbi:GNAT family N-acetyltransferase [Oxalobacter paraformigenes]|uniref:N-acetyltransferase domain-containing protein n=1 Tax=Oxalobacter paraformigenes TaxID=556268 RepID=C3X495_9BURK|nr:GNAT family N-acetyltransferase [Oxalobacter paraformigenes]EEO28031.1 hypothetical protein OFAG_01184 [Oxalobacter paraformigenes]
MRIERIAEDKRRFLPLLLIADPDEGMIGRYLDRGDLFALYDSGELKSVCVVTAESETVCELKNLATEETARNRGYATALIRHVLDVYRDRFSVMQVGTGDFPKTLRFYEQCGFVFSHRVAGFFTDHYPEPVFEEGVLLTDMVYLKQAL